MTLNSIFEWDAVPGAVSYHVMVTDSVGVPINTVNAGDSDVNGIAGTGGALFYPVVKYLLNKGSGTYKFFVRSVPTSGPPSLWAQLNFEYTGLSAPTNLRFS